MVSYGLIIQFNIGIVIGYEWTSHGIGVGYFLVSSNMACWKIQH